MSFIKLSNINKSYIQENTSVSILKNISLDIYEGDMISIMGPSGSGKSTLLHILGLLDSYSIGKYEFEKTDISKLTKNQIAMLRNSKIGFVFQQFALINNYSAIENVELPLLQSNIFRKYSQKISSKIIKEKAFKKLKLVGLEEHIKKYPSQLSGGQQQRVAIARALSNKPALLIADEPTGALDQNTGEEIMKLLKEINLTGTTIVIVTHDNNIASYCQKTFKIIDGKIE
ncbi:MAG: ABC transporter ATP-binding protein [Clostridiales bacterium]